MKMQTILEKNLLHFKAFVSKEIVLLKPFDKNEFSSIVD